MKRKKDYVMIKVPIEKIGSVIEDLSFEFKEEINIITISYQPGNHYTIRVKF